jgi:site-specific DNA-methyltransferase (adenine-specific)
MKKEPYFEDEDILLFNGDCLEVLPSLEAESVDLIFADPPYRLSNGGITCQAGKIALVDKADWDKSMGFEKDYEFTYNWIKLCKEILKPNGSIWISGTPHNIFQVGYALQALGFHIINEIVWYKPNAPPNLACRCFAHSHESVIWAKKSKESKHEFNYELMKRWDDRISPSGKQMRSVWCIALTPLEEKNYGKHPTQKPLELLRRIVLASSKEGDVVLDPFSGSGTTGVMANRFDRKFIGIDIEKEYCDLTLRRINGLRQNLKTTNLINNYGRT